MKQDIQPAEELLVAQATLGATLQSQAQFLRFALSVSNQNLEAVKKQLLAVQKLLVSLEAQDDSGQEGEHRGV